MGSQRPPLGHFVEGTNNRVVTITGAPACVNQAHMFIVDRCAEQFLYFEVCVMGGPTCAACVIYICSVCYGWVRLVGSTSSAHIQATQPSSPLPFFPSSLLPLFPSSPRPRVVCVDRQAPNGGRGARVCPASRVRHPLGPQAPWRGPLRRLITT